MTSMMVLGLLALGPRAFGQEVGSSPDVSPKDAAKGQAKPKDAPKDANDPGYVLEQNPGRLPETTNQCIFFRTLYDWKALNNSNLIVWAPTRNHPYHLQLDRPCFGLRFAHSIGFTSRDSRLCGYGGDSVLVESGGGRPDRCPIGAITKLTEESLKSLLEQAPGRKSGDKTGDKRADE
ncbi:MAG: hypothetical protein JNK21_03935 [Rhodospirillaceae bacterium]|nr:hypothetical protein [Rhodospirillaceae bacterium]